MRISVQKLSVARGLDAERIFFLDDIFLLLDGEFGIELSGRTIAFEDKPLLNLYLLKKYVMSILFLENSDVGDLTLASFLSEDRVEIKSSNLEKISGEIISNDDHARFTIKTVAVSKDIGKHMRKIRALLVNEYPALEDSWQMAVVFEGVI